MAVTYPVTITNPGAESGLTGWTTAGGFSTRSADPAPFEGAAYFYGGDGTAASSAYQDLPVPAGAEADVDAGDATFAITWHQNSFNGDDLGRVDLEFFDTGMVSLGTSAGVDDAPEGWTERTHSAPAPVGTRTVRVTMQATRVAGSNNDAYFDALDPRVVQTSSVQARTTQVYQQVLSTNASEARTTQVYQQVLSTNASEARTTQVYQQVLVSRSQKLIPQATLLWGNTEL